MASSAAEAAILDLIFLNIAWPHVGDAAGLQPSATLGSLWVALHTADPGEAGTQATNEATYLGYARVAVPRGSAGWSRSGSNITNVSLVQFPECTGGSENLTHFSIGLQEEGASTIIVSRALGNPSGSIIYVTANGRAPGFGPGGLVVNAT